MSFVLLTTPFNDHKKIALLKLNRPKSLNAINNELLSELRDHLKTLDNNNEIRVVLITGDSKAFAAGADLQSLAKSNAVEQVIDERERIWKDIAMFSKPLIALVDGFALGGGCELAMACDFIIAGDKARFGQPEINVGLMPGAGGTQRFTRALGKSKAMMYLMTGQMMDAYEAEKIGLAAKVVPSFTLLQEGFEMAKKIATKPPLSMRLLRESVHKSFEVPLRDGLDFERRNFYLTFATQDAFEGMSAFLEKRKPDYKGI